MNSKERQARSDGARAAIMGAPNVMSLEQLIEMSQGEIFAWREGYAEYSGDFAIIQHAGMPNKSDSPLHKSPTLQR